MCLYLCRGLCVCLCVFVFFFSYFCGSSFQTSVLCKAAVHAGIFPDQFGGVVTVEEEHGLRYYESVQANGIKSKPGSLSETLFTFSTSDCSRQIVLQPVSVSSSWEKDVFDGSRSDRSPSLGRFVTPTGIWEESKSDLWLQIDLGEKKRITGILTKGSDSGDYVESYKIMYKEKSRWRTYTDYNSSEDTIFQGNVDNLYQTRNTFRPSFATRYVRVVPLQWHRKIGLSVELLGCLYVRENPGCWKQVKTPSARQQSTEFTFSYSSEKDHRPKMDLVTSDMADYQQPLMLGVGTVSRKGSTFRPMDTDNTKDTTNEATSHYDFLHTANQYALPLTNQEPEYATPIIERHIFRKDAFVPDPSYSVPGVVLSKSSSFRATDNSKYRKVVAGSVSAGYQTPQTKRNRPKHSEGVEPNSSSHSEEVYDSPKNRNPAVLQNGGCAEYQRPQTKGYSSPRDCVRLDPSVTHRPDPEGCSLSGT
ncbi:Discoidin, CUB and LCCL domain-containing protein 1 [Bagarius yarrelli]|uniref:Discoidin, CUB and LCCL domain-containing protein 1 n=1 Tax=Bagarius yarrelli TaxID=175774 RepID=A0A556UYA5_BAGYA|nr:Discoidin, CUB and LCCL domain-containing protein 1 [Bagarius yarrelli]